MVFCSRLSIDISAVCDLALSCWNNLLCRSITCMRLEWRISSLYITAVKFPRTGASPVLLSFENRRPHHDTTFTVAIHLLKTGGRQTLILASVLYPYSTISFLQEKTGLVAKPNSAPVSKWSVP